ncbi:MAG: extracellular solute-binding protein [Elainellaceae cyanobacterium]
MTYRRPQSHKGRSPKTPFTRRRFLQFSAAAFSGAALSNCARSISQNQSSEPEQSTSATAGSEQTLYLYTWADYNSDELYQRFQEQTGIEVVASVYDSNEVMLAKLQSGGGDQFSIIYPSDYIVQDMIASNLLLKFDRDRLQGFDQIMERWQNPTYDANSAHSIPFNWGTTGLIYNTEVVDDAPTDWNYLWDNQETLSGKMTLLDDVRETMGAVLKSLGYSYNSTDPAEIEAAYNKLIELKPALAGFKTYGWEDQLISGDLAVCMTYSTLGNLLPEENPQLVYVIPESGTSIWTDTIAIPANAPNVDAAYAWINFILEPENAALAAETLQLGTPNQGAFEQLPTAMKENPKLFPPQSILSKSQGLEPIGETISLYDEYWTKVQSS